MIRNQLSVLGAVMLIAGALGCGIADEGTAAETAGGSGEENAIAAAGAWLELVDAGEYGGSWDASAGLFRKAVGKKQWVQSLEAVRSPLGKLVSRDVASKQYATELPGAPDGEYVVIQFTTSFENKRTAVETVTPMLEEDGTWKVSGYFIK